MASFIIDWQQDNESGTAYTATNHFKFSPLSICTKDGFNFGMDARMTLQIDDDSIIVQNFGSFPIFVDNMLNTLIRNFFTYKEREHLVSSRLKIQEELVKLLQERLDKYYAKITNFSVVYMSTPQSFSIQNEKSRSTIKEIYKIKSDPDIPDVPDQNYDKIYTLLSNIFLLLVLLSIAILVDVRSVTIDDNIPFRLGPFISMAVIFVGVFQYFKIKEIRQIDTRKE